MSSYKDKTHTNVLIKKHYFITILFNVIDYKVLQDHSLCKKFLKFE